MSPEAQPRARSTTTQSLTTSLVLVTILILALFPSAFHFLWTLPLRPFLTPASRPTHPAPASCASLPPPISPPSMSWFQKSISLPSKSRGSYLVTDTIVSQLPELKTYKVGLLHLFIQHTSCALSLNENWDEDVRADMSDALDRIVPAEGDRSFFAKGEGVAKGSGERLTGLYRHDAEGKDDMPAHVKSALIGASVTIPISNGKLATGTWQGVWYLEFRASKHSRKIVATIQGEKM